MPLGTNLLIGLTVFADIIIVLFGLEYLAITGGLRQKRLGLWNWFGKHALWFGFAIALVSMAGSLYFSDYLGYEPCKLCWYERIFMYSQVFLFGLALWRREPLKIWAYSTLLSIVGGAITLFHYYIQVVPKPLVTIPCAALGYSASCTETFSVNFGYITIPMMALSAFGLLLILGRLAVRTRVSGH